MRLIPASRLVSFSVASLAFATAAARLQADFSVKTDRIGSMPDPGLIVITDITPNASDIIMAVRDPGAGAQAILLLNGQKVAADIGYRGLALSSDGKQFAFVAGDQGGGCHIVANGQRGDHYDGLAGYDYAGTHFGNLFYTSDSRHFAYVAANKGDQFAVIDGKEQKHYGGVFYFTFSPDGQHWAYAARAVKGSTGSMTCVVDGQESVAYEGILRLMFIPQSKDVAFEAVFDSHTDGVVMRGKDVDRLSFVWSNIAFTGDGKHYAYGASRTNPHPTLGNQVATFLVVDGEAQAVAPDPAASGGRPRVIQVVYSPDGSRMAYVRSDPIGEATYTTSPQGRAERTVISRPRVVLDGNISPLMDVVGPLTFSADGKTLAYVERTGKQWQAVINNKSDPAYDMLASKIAFTADGRHYAYAARKDGKWRMVMDGQEIPEFEPLHTGAMVDMTGDVGPFTNFPYAFDPDGTLTYIATKGGQLYRVHVTP